MMDWAKLLRVVHLVWARWFVVFLIAVSFPTTERTEADSRDKGSSDRPRTRLSTPDSGSPATVQQWTIYRQMKNSAFPPVNAPTVAVHAPAGFDQQKPLHLVIFLHGFLGCVKVLMEKGQVACGEGGPLQEGWGLALRHDAAATNTLFVIPQLAFMKREGNPGYFKKRGGFRNFLKELLSETLAEKFARTRGIDDIADIALVAHSAGFETALAILQYGEVNSLVRNVVLMDALYTGVDGFVTWLSHTPVKDARLISIYLGKGTTYSQSLLLQRRLERIMGKETVAHVTASDLKSAIRSFRATIVTGTGPHRKAPENHLADVLNGLLNAGSSARTLPN
jgi:pimeloyl-ACP methyl ester carboxylesterase